MIEHFESEYIARRFHEIYEELAPNYGYTTRRASAVPWKEVPEPNKSLMIAVADKLISEGTVKV
jgi:hypothetical protein